MRALMLALFFLASCTPAIRAIPTETPIPAPASTVSSSQPFATPTDIQLPFNDKNVDHEYCQIPSVKLSIAEAQNLSEEEIAKKLMDLFLAYFYVPQAPDYC